MHNLIRLEVQEEKHDVKQRRMSDGEDATYQSVLWGTVGSILAIISFLLLATNDTLTYFSKDGLVYWLSGLTVLQTFTFFYMLSLHLIISEKPKLTSMIPTVR